VRFATGLARAGVTVISGLARGIDAAAHQGALRAGGRTLAVLASDVVNVYPPEHRGLASEIARSGAILSETCLNQRPTAGVFPQRNRIISGLSLGVIIVEASVKSGALHTARHASEQNRDVLAVPGRVDSPTSAGCHALLRDGATLIRDVDDVLEALGPLAQPVMPNATGHIVHTPRELKLSEQERTVLDLITLEPIAIDTVLATASLDASRVLATLTVLELRHLVQRLPGSFVRRRV
jgi:DNA processing protein